MFCFQQIFQPIHPPPLTPPPPPPHVPVVCLRGTPTKAESLARLVWLVSTVPAWAQHMPPAILHIYAHSKQIKTISRGYATGSAILVLAANCVWHRRWDKTFSRRVWYYMTARLRKFSSQESTPRPFMDSALSLLSNNHHCALLRTSLTLKFSLALTQEPRHISTRCGKSPIWSKVKNL